MFPSEKYYLLQILLLYLEHLRVNRKVKIEETEVKEGEN